MDQNSNIGHGNRCKVHNLWWVRCYKEEGSVIQIAGLDAGLVVIIIEFK